MPTLQADVLKTLALATAAATFRSAKLLRIEHAAACWLWRAAVTEELGPHVDEVPMIVACRRGPCAPLRQHSAVAGGR